MSLQAREGPTAAVLERLEGVKQQGNGWIAKCPSHDDRVASLSVSTGDDGRVLLHCHATCTPEQVLGAVGMTLADLFPKAEGPGRVVKTYDYLSEDGELLFQVVRYEPKSFRQRRPDGRGGWIWSMKGVRRVLYNLPQVHASPAGSLVFFVEGEKDADNLGLAGVLATTGPMGAGKFSEELAHQLAGKRVVILPDNDESGEQHAALVASALMGLAESVRIVRLPNLPPKGDASDWLEAGGTKEQLLALVETDACVAPAQAGTIVPGGLDEGPELQQRTAESGPESPEVLVAPDEYRVIEQTIDALTADPDLYARGEMLVRVLRSDYPQDGINRPEGSPTISAVPPANLRERLSRYTRLVRDKKGDLVPTYVPAWLVNGIHARAYWPGIRPLVGISESPILRPDGTVCQNPGYDPATGVLYSPAEHAAFPPIPKSVRWEDAQQALASLLEVVHDFRFEAPEHRAAWLAGLLTPFARFAFSGPTPMFVIDANIRGAGKGLLAQTIGRIALGREMPVSSYAHDSEEMRKKLTSIALAGDRMILFDNVEGALGNDALDRALTSTLWKDRILGVSREVELPLMPAWYATGNNVQVGADTCRRVIHIRLDVLEERPEERNDFRHPDLMAWVMQNRGRLLMDALTILIAYCQAGRPKLGLTPFGSFEGWSSLVREAVVWVGLPDPYLTRTRLAASCDTTADTLSQFIEAVKAYDHRGTGFVCSILLRELYGEPRPGDDRSMQMRAAIETLVGCPPGKVPTAGQLGNKLRAFRRRVIGHRYLDTDAVKGEHGVTWRLREDSARVSQSQSQNRIVTFENGDVGGAADSADSVTTNLNEELAHCPF